MFTARSAARVRAAAVAILLPALVLGCDGTADTTTEDRESANEAPLPQTAQVTSGPVQAPRGAIANDQKVDPELTAALARGEARDAIVVLDDRELRRTQVIAEVMGSDLGQQLLVRAYDAQKARLARHMRTGHATLLRDYQHLPVRFVRIESAEALAAFAADADVRSVLPDMRTRRTGLANLDLIKQPVVAAHGLAGQGTTVAVLDSGLDYKRPDFGCTAPGVPADTCKVAEARDIASDDGKLDDDGHGTNVAGIVLSVAPSARVIGLDVFEGEYAWTSTLLSGVNWVIENRARYNIAALNMSLGGGAFSSPCSGTGLAEAMENARAAGVVVVTASGNEGHTDALSFPACAPAAVSVGAVYHANLGQLTTDICTDERTAADRVACFSNTASFLSILAPGVEITAAGSTMSGTSQAAPHVAGAAAILRARYPKESANALVTRLLNAGPRVKDPRTGEMKPRLDLASLMKDALPATPAAPAGDVRINGGARATNTVRVALFIKATQGDPTEICVSNSTTCSTWKAITAARDWTLPAGDGTKRVAVFFRDAAGRTSVQPALAYIKLDTAVPSDGMLQRSMDSKTDKKSNATVLKWSGFNDAGSGIANYRITMSMGMPPVAGCGGNSVVWSGTSTTAEFSAPTASTMFFRLCAVDAAGNWSPGVVSMIAR